ncbi:hypothetical protein BJ165DRAFT_1531485 [Panaeolus papilionaceus]|nr:hypothetical protein BJ165DRAFT_1531485 [Panaeolus papilionaceus]
MSFENAATQRSASATQRTGTHRFRSSSQTPGPSERHPGPSQSSERRRASSIQAPPEPYFFTGSGDKSGFSDKFKSIIEKAEIVVSDFRKSHDPSAKLKSIGMLYSIFELRDRREHYQQRWEGFHSFCEQLEQEQFLQDQAVSYGDQIASGGGQRPSESGNNGNGQPSKSDIEDHISFLNGLGLHFRDRKGKRKAKQPSSSPGSSSSESSKSSSSSSEDEHSGHTKPKSKRKKVRLTHKQMPWVKNQPKHSIKADPACVENAKILRLLSIDIGFVLNELQHDSTPTKPSGFPYSEWSNILKGNPINLDKVLSSLHRVHAPKESTGCLGDVEISIGHSKPSRRIRNQSEWSSSWNRAIRGYVFIFPHRRDELVEYGEWIEQQFESLVEVSAETKSRVDPASGLTTSIDGLDLNEQLCLPMVHSSNDPTLDQVGLGKPLEISPLQFATSSTSVGDVKGHPADTSTNVGNAERKDTDELHVRKQGEIARNFVPDWKRYNDWDEDTPAGTVEWTLTAPPLPYPPQEILNDPISSKTVRDNPAYFPIITPVNISILHTELVGHPNSLLVESIISSLTTGFWPLVKSFPPEYPVTLDESAPTPQDPAKAAFLCEQRDVELAKNRYSPAFSQLLPGMYCMPIHAVPKDNGDSLQLVTDHSHGVFSLNSLIDKTSMPKAPLDNMKVFGAHMIAMQRRHPGKKLKAWKYDVAEAYRLIPMHPLWQIKQVERIEGMYHVNRCNVFGGRASQLLFIAFIALVSWIATVKRGISELCAYSDDHFGLAVEGDETWYAPYGRFLPSPQARLLMLWDDLGIPHKEKKQISALLDELEYWVSLSTTPAKRGCTLRQWQHLTGWVNWALNVFPLVKPALSSIYEKMRGKSSPTIWFRPNNVIRAELRWAISHIHTSPGV